MGDPSRSGQSDGVRCDGSLGIVAGPSAAERRTRPRSDEKVQRPVGVRKEVSDLLDAFEVGMP